MKAKLFFLLLTLSGVNYIPAASAMLSTNEEVLVNYIDQHKTDQLKLLENMVNINSGTENSQGVKKLAKWCGLSSKAWALKQNGSSCRQP